MAHPLDGNRIYGKIKKIIFVLLLATISFTLYVAIINRNTKNMTTRQKVLKALYPAMMWFTKNTNTNTTLLSGKNVAPPVSIYSFQLPLIDGQVLNLEDLKGKKILLVNTASDCGYTGQYEGLEKLYREHQQKLIVLGFPANDFKEQEKGTDTAIAGFCRLNFGVTFPLMKKSKVIKGSNQNQLYTWLSDKNQNGWNDQAPTWNFCKYLVDEQGKLAYFFSSSIEPMSDELLKAIAE